MTVDSYIQKKAGYGMISDMFSSMHELLDYIIQHYEEADDEEREEYCFRIQELKETNDLFMDHWVSFEEKLAIFFEFYREREHEASSAKSELQVALDESTLTQTILAKELLETISQEQPCNECDLYTPHEDELILDRAQGYYKLFMFTEAADLFHQIITTTPECNMARLYYGMTLMHMRNWNEAQRQFQLLTVLSDFPKWLALSFNALGCIHAIKLNMNQAEQLFLKAYSIYPQFEDSLKNLQCCMETPQQLSLYFGSTELICT